MELHNLKPAQGSTKTKKRIGRGQGSGRGGTSTRGHKGAKSRSGYSRKRNFEGGQMPLQMRLPKRGFKNPNRVEFSVVNIDAIQALSDKFGITEFGFTTMVEKGLVKKDGKLKILGNGELSATVSVEAHACSASAKSAIETKGGSVKML